MYLKLCWTNLTHTSEPTKCMSNCVDQTPPMPARTQNVSQHVLTKPFYAREETNCISRCIDQAYHMRARTQNISHLALSKHIPFQRWHKVDLNMCWPNPSHASEDRKCISTSVEQTSPMPANTQNASQHELTKPLLLAWTKNVSKHELTKTPPMQAGTKIIYLRVLTKPLPYQRTHNIDLNMTWPNPSHTSMDTKYITCFAQTFPIPTWTLNESQHVLTEPLPCQQGHKIYLKLYWPY